MQSKITIHFTPAELLDALTRYAGYDPNYYNITEQEFFCNLNGDDCAELSFYAIRRSPNETAMYEQQVRAIQRYGTK